MLKILNRAMSNKEIINKQKIFNLIEQITPLNNQYRDLIKNPVNGTEILVLMWKVGNLIELFIKKNKIKPHNLYWQIYGKAEGLKTSYITRDFLSYCLRIKKYFLILEDISSKFPYLQKYSLFREAFPLLENPKFKLSKQHEDEIIKVLNSNNEIKKIKKIILKIKANRIGIKNTRKQKLNEMKPIIDNFVIIYNEVYLLIKSSDQLSLENFINSFKKDFLIKLSQEVSALTQENLYIPELEDRNDIPDNWIKFIFNLKYLLKEKVEIRNRFRRLISPRKLFDLADMINAFTSDRGVNNYRKRKNIIT